MLSFTCLHWLADHYSFLREVATVLRSGGELHFTMPVQASPLFLDAFIQIQCSAKWSHLFRDFVPPLTWWSNKTFRTSLVGDQLESGYKTLLESANLEPLSVKVVYVQDVFTSVEELKQYMIPWCPLRQAVPQSELSQFLDDLIQLAGGLRICKDQSEQSYELSFYHLHVHAVKKG